MDKMVDLKRPKPKVKEDSKKAGEATSHEERPYCLRVTLEAPELEALGLKPSDFSDMKPFTATVVLDPINIRDIECKTEDTWDKNRNKSVEFQIMKISIGELTSKKESKFAKFNDQNKKGAGE